MDEFDYCLTGSAAQGHYLLLIARVGNRLIVREKQ